MTVHDRTRLTGKVKKLPKIHSVVFLCSDDDKILRPVARSRNRFVNMPLDILERHISPSAKINKILGGFQLNAA